MSVELVNPDIDRVDAVNGPATGIPFLIFKNAEGGPAPAVEAPAEEVAKSEEVIPTQTGGLDTSAPVAVLDDVAKSEEPAPAEGEAPVEEVIKSETEDADKAGKAAKALAALRQVVIELGQSEAAEEEYSADAFDLMDASEAIDYALAILAKFALTEAVDASTVEKDAAGLRKALHLEVHEHKDEEPAPAAPALAEAPVEDALVPEAPAAAEEPVPPVAKAADGVLPSGLMELLSTFVEGYSHYMEAKASGAEDELNTEDAAAAPAEAPKEAAPAPVEPAKAPEAPEAHAAPAAPAHAPAEAPAEPAHTEAPKAPEEDPAEKLKKSMEVAIAEAVAKATEPLLKQIDVLERTPVDSGPMLAGQTPDKAGTPLVRGQEEGAVAKGLTSAAAQTAPGTNPLAEGIKALYGRR